MNIIHNVSKGFGLVLSFSPKRPATFFYPNVQSDAFYIQFLAQHSPRPPSMTPILSRITRLHVSSNYEQRSSNAPGSSQNQTVYAMSGVRRQPPMEPIKPLFSHIRNLALNLSLGTFYREYFRVGCSKQPRREGQALPADMGVSGNQQFPPSIFDTNAEKVSGSRECGTCDSLRGNAVDGTDACKPLRAFRIQ